VLFSDTNLGYFSANAAFMGATFPNLDSFHYAKGYVVTQPVLVMTVPQRLCIKNATAVAEHNRPSVLIVNKIVTV
jgi:hypothetical protein